MADVRCDWYQTDTNVVICYFRRNLTNSDVKVTFNPTEVCVFHVTPTGDELMRSFKLTHPIDPEGSQYSVSSVKIELKLRKAVAVRWNQLESETSPADAQVTAAPPMAGDAGIAHQYPSSSKSSKDWNKLEKEADAIEDETDPLNKLFRSIYAEASEDTRRAMIKSFTESGGTVLSTNWDEVGKGKVEMKPPDGMEYKKYEI